MCAWHENEIFFSLFTSLELITLEEFDDLVYVSMISLTCKFEHFVNICFPLVKSTHIRILFPDINFNLKIFLKPFPILFHWLTFRIIEIFFILELFVKCLWDILISHGVSSHLQYIHIFFVCKNICVHTLVVNQMEFQAKANF